MPVTIKVNGVSNSLVHKGSNGISTATLPDVCKTPSPGGPIPVPYPNISMSSDLANGTKSVKADGGNMIAIKGSEFSRSTGDEPGTAGGVKSSTFIKESTWILYSFDVRIEGQGACRLTDKKFQNHQNTVDMGGVLQMPVFKPPSDPECAKLYEEIFKFLYAVRSTPGMGLKGLAWRWDEAAINRGGWTAADNESHMKQYSDQQTGLNNRLKRWKKQKCNDDDLPPGAKFVTEKVPELGSKKTFEEALKEYSQSKSSSLNVEALAKALGVSAGVVIGIVIATRIIRCFPPLLPLQFSPI